MQDFTTYLQSNNLSPITCKEYTRQVNLFTAWYGNDELINCEKKNILAYLSYLKNTKNLQAISRNNALIALRHYFNYLASPFGGGLVGANPTALIILRGIKKRKLNHIYNPEELTQLADNFYQLQVKTAEENLTLKANRNTTLNSYYAQLRNYTMLQFFIYQGLTTREVLALTTDDIELHKATVHIPSGTQRGKARTLPLQAAQIGALMQYLHKIKPQLAATENTKLFLPVQQKNISNCPTRILVNISSKLKRIDNNFNNLAQLRASVITYWIQTFGLRKAQYLAGHKSINSTEEFLPNDIANLTEDIIKFNPF
jgi:site-specific recombinase XerD